MLLVSAVFTVSTVFAMSAEGKVTFQYPSSSRISGSKPGANSSVEKRGFCRMIDLTCIVLPGATLFLSSLHTSHSSLFDVVIFVVECFAFLQRQSTAFGIRASSTYSNSYRELLAVSCLVPNAPGTEISSPVSSGNVVLTGSTGVGLAYTSSSSDLVGISRLALHFAAFSEAPLLLTTTSHNTFSEISHILYEVNESTYTSMCRNNERVHRYLFTDDDDDDDYKYYRE